MDSVLCEIKSYIQPFERRLALAELRALTGSDPVPVNGDLDTAKRFQATTTSPERLQTELAYWERVGTPALQETSQIRSEATYAVARNGISLEDLPATVPTIITSKLPRKRILRYATHGLHEYRGKFFPQLVRALMNMACVPRDGLVADPMCGSGTTIVEAVRSGRTAYGLDMNPLSVYVAEAKCQALALSAQDLIVAFGALSNALSKPPPRLGGSSHFATLPARDQTYLMSWFDPTVLQEMDHIERCIGLLDKTANRNLYTLCLSNILRSVSWQKDADLRVRKEVVVLRPGEVVSRFLDEARRSTKTVVAYISERGEAPIGDHAVAEGDARVLSKRWQTLRGCVDAIVTSPPYATALPYLDTDRLSLVYLGLLTRPEHRTRDLAMIGNREVTERRRAVYWSEYESSRHLLPEGTRAMIERVDRLNRKGDAGFRRRNLSALLAKYFFDMRAVIQQQLTLLKPSGTLFMVVGNNRTTAGGEEIAIETADHLAEIAAGVGFRLAGRQSMELLVSRDIFRKNATPSEYILTLQHS